jgi:ribosomal protein S20
MRSMTRRRKLTFAAGAVGAALLVAGLGAAGAIAASRVFSPSEESKAVIDDAAKQLGVQPQELSDALKQALKNRVDDAVDAGMLTKEQGQRLKERIDSGEYPFLLGPGFGFHERGFGLAFGERADLLETAASYLGMSEDDLREELQDKTLAEIAKDKGKSVSGLVAALVAVEAKKIDQAVSDGRITKTQATEIKSRLDERMQALVNGELHRSPVGPHSGFWRSPGSPRGPPPAFGGPRA